MEGKNSEGEDSAGEEEEPGIKFTIFCAVEDEEAPGGLWGLNTEAEKADEGLVEDHAWDHEGRVGGECGDEIRKNVLDDDPKKTLSVTFCRFDKGLRFNRQCLGAHDAGDDEPFNAP